MLRRTALVPLLLFLGSSPLSAQSSPSETETSAPPRPRSRLTPRGLSELRTTTGGRVARERPDPKTPVPPRTTEATPDRSEEAVADSKEKKGFLAGLRAFIRRNLVWILTVFGLVLAGALVWAFLARRPFRHGNADVEADDDDDEAPALRPRSANRRYSSTQIRAADVNARLGTSIAGTPIETEREYALVVDEEALGGSRPGEEGGAFSVAGREVRDLLESGDFDKAYARYRELIEEDGSLAFEGPVEKTLSQHFLRLGDSEKAARILEHHVATQKKEEIHPRVYFHLGYIHALSGTYKKARRFFRLFAQSEKDPRFVARAKAILEDLDSKTGSRHG